MHMERYKRHPPNHKKKQNFKGTSGSRCSDPLVTSTRCRSNKMAPSGKKSCHFTQVSPAIPQAGGQKGHCVLWSTSLCGPEPFLGKAASSASIENHIYVLFIQRKIKNFIDNQWNSWFNLYFSLQIACLYWLVLWNQQYSFWTATIPRITQLLHHAKQEASQHIQSTRTQLLTNPCPDTASGFCWDKHQSQTIFKQSLKN